MKVFFPAVGFLLTLALVDDANARPPTVGPLPRRVVEERIVGCSCGFSRAGSLADRELIAWEMDHDPKALAYVDGAVIELQLHSQKDNKTRTVWDFRNAEVGITVSCTEVPTKRYAESEGVVLRGRLLVTRGREHVEVSIEGTCGC